MSGFLIDYPFAERLYPDAMAVVRRLGEFGPTVILSDGDVVFQPRQGHYALDAAATVAFPAADIDIERIGDLLAIDMRELLGPKEPARTPQGPQETP